MASSIRTESLKQPPRLLSAAQGLRDLSGLWRFRSEPLSAARCNRLRIKTDVVWVGGRFESSDGYPCVTVMDGVEDEDTEDNDMGQ